MADITKALKIEISGDINPYMKAVDEMKQKTEAALRDIVRTFSQQKLGKAGDKQGLGGMLLPSQQELQAANKSLDSIIQKHNQGLAVSNKMIQLHQKEIERVVALKEKATEEDRKALQIAEQKIAAARAEGDFHDRELKKALAIKQGQKPDWKNVLGESDLRLPFLQAGKYFGLAFAAVLGAGKIWEHFQNIPIKIVQAMGAATEGLIGNQLKDLASGNIARIAAFAGERAEAIQDAMTKLQNTNFTSRLMNLEALGGSALTGSAWIMNNMKGRGLPGILGEITRALGIPQVLQMAGERYEQSYQANRMNQFVQDVQAGFEGRVKQKPLKEIAAEQLNANASRNLMLQRMMGLNYQSFYGPKGFQQRAINEGFSPELAEQMALQIQSAGGSTRAMKELSTFGLQVQRGFDLTNAGQLLGKISGGVGDANASRDVLKHILEDGVKKGVDSSDYREEQRRMAEMQADIIARTGAKTSDDIRAAITGYSNLVGNQPTIRELEGAKNAYQQIQDLSGETGGRMGYFQAAAFMKSKDLQKMGYEAYAALMNMDKEFITADNPMVQAAAVAMGGKMTPEKLAARLRKDKEQNIMRTAGISPESMKTLNNAYKTLGFTAGQSLNLEQLKLLKSSNPEAFKAYMQSESAAARIFQTKGGAEAEAFARFFRIGGQKPGAGGKIDERKFFKGFDTGRIEDEYQKSQAAIAGAFLDNFRQNIQAIVPNTEALRQLNATLIMVQSAYERLTNNIDKATFLRGESEIIKNAYLQYEKTKSQPTGGKGF